MTNCLKTTNFSDYYNNLELLQRRAFRMDVCALMEIEYHTFLRRLHADRWNPVEREAITNLINEKQYETH